MTRVAENDLKWAQKAHFLCQKHWLGAVGWGQFAENDRALQGRGGVAENGQRSAVVGLWSLCVQKCVTHKNRRALILKIRLVSTGIYYNIF